MFYDWKAMKQQKNKQFVCARSMLWRKIEFVKVYSDRCFPNTTKHYDLYSSGLYSNE